MRVISSDAGRQHGLMPTLALVDELHAHKNPDLYVALKTAMGKNPEAQLVTISTAGHDTKETLGQLRTAVFDKGDVEQAGPRFRIARVAASNFVLLEWACRDDDDLADPAVVKLANPASFVTEAFLLEQIHSPGLHPVEFATYHANVWRSGVDSWLAHGAFEACSADAMGEEWAGLPPGADVWLGVDMGRSNDAASVVAVAVRDDDVVVAECSIYHPPEEGKLAFETVERAILDLHEHWRIRACAYDPWHFDRSAELLEDKGVPMVPFPQSNERMGPATHLLLESINTRRIRHSGDAEFVRHVVNGHAEQTARGIRLKKDPKTRREDDACLALCMAHSLARGPDERSVYERRDDDFLL
jgi:phage terminase large subunit-like protein